MVISPYLVGRHGVRVLKHRGDTRLAKQTYIFDRVFAEFWLKRFVANGSPQIEITAGLDKRFTTGGDGREVRVTQFWIKRFGKRCIRLFRVQVRSCVITLREM